MVETIYQLWLPWNDELILRLEKKVSDIFFVAINWNSLIFFCSYLIVTSFVFPFCTCATCPSFIASGLLNIELDFIVLFRASLCISWRIYAIIIHWKYGHHTILFYSYYFFNSLIQAKGGGLCFFSSNSSLHDTKYPNEEGHSLLAYINGDHEYVIFNPLSSSEVQIAKNARTTRQFPDKESGKIMFFYKVSIIDSIKQLNTNST